MAVGWYALGGPDGKRVVGPFDYEDREAWVEYQNTAGAEWRSRQHSQTGKDPWSVAWDDLEWGVWVSTVFLGLDHSLGGGGDLPVVFETMAFGLPSDEEICERSCTWEQAEETHEQVVRKVLAMRDSRQVDSDGDEGE